MKNQGIALIQVLLITAILSVLAMYLTNTARDQVTIAQWANDKAQAQVALHSAQAQLIFTLLTEPKSLPINNLSDNSKSYIQQPSTINNTGITDNWNFFAEPFFINNHVKITVQDQAGLLDTRYLNAKMLVQLIKSKGHSEQTTNTIVDNLLDWQDLDKLTRTYGNEDADYKGAIRNGAMPDVHEFIYLKNVTPEILQLMIKNTTLYRQAYLNPLNATEDILLSMTNQSTVAQILSLRAARQLTATNFKQLTGIGKSDDISFRTSDTFSISFTSQIGESKVTKSILIHINPYALSGNRPINIYANRG